MGSESSRSRDSRFCARSDWKGGKGVGRYGYAPSIEGSASGLQDSAGAESCGGDSEERYGEE